MDTMKHTRMRTKVKIQAKDKNMQTLLQKYYDHYMKSNPDLEDDLFKLTNSIMLFNMKWGTNYTITNPRSRTK